jgi:hypothetical protein
MFVLYREIRGTVLLLYQNRWIFFLIVLSSDLYLESKTGSVKILFFIQKFVKRFTFSPESF